MCSAILWQDERRTVTLIDLPRSIVSAQGGQDARELLSCEPLQHPFPSNEPKSAAAKARLQVLPADAALHAAYQGVVQAALETVRKHHEGLWCSLLQDTV